MTQAYVLVQTHGIAGIIIDASSMERLPTEIGTTESVRRFERIGRAALRGQVRRGDR